MKYGRVEYGALQEIRDFSENEIPANKQFLWYTVIEDIPAEYDEFYHNLSEYTVEISEEDKSVTLTYTIEAKPLEDLQILIKEEAQRRILEVYPLWKQYNMAVDKFTLMDTPDRTPEEEQKLEEVTSNINWVKSMRLRSNEIELMDPIPKNYTDDSYWVI